MGGTVSETIKEFTAATTTFPVKNPVTTAVPLEYVQPVSASAADVQAGHVTVKAKGFIVATTT